MNSGKVQIICLLITKLNPANNNINKEREKNKFCIWKYQFTDGLSEMSLKPEIAVHTKTTVNLVDLGSQALFEMFWKSQCFCVMKIFLKFIFMCLELFFRRQ